MRERAERLRRASLAVLVLLVIEYAIGAYVNLYVTVPPADHHGSLDSVIANGPAALTVHAVLGLLLWLGALAVLVQAIKIRRGWLIALSVAGLLALVMAAVAGASFTSGGQTENSLAMAMLTGVAMLCYAGSLFAAGIDHVNAGHRTASLDRAASASLDRTASAPLDRSASLGGGDA
jgi:hypothetical protein